MRMMQLSQASLHSEGAVVRDPEIAKAWHKLAKPHRALSVTGRPAQGLCLRARPSAIVSEARQKTSVEGERDKAVAKRLLGAQFN